MRVYDTPIHQPPITMANKRRKGVARVTLTIPDELLERAEAEAKERGLDRLAVIREALENYLKHTPKAQTGEGE